jgi:hypothetical protein
VKSGAFSGKSAANAHGDCFFYNDINRAVIQDIIQDGKSNSRQLRYAVEGKSVLGEIFI